jgi:hypothetical protein
MKKVIIALCLAASISARLSAELKYTIHMESKKPEGKMPPPANPLLAMMGDALVKQVLPEGTADIVYVLGDKGARIETVNAAMGQAAGTVTLSQPDGSLIVMNPKDQTYWKASIESATALIQGAGVKPEATSTRSGEFETVAGVRCERVPFTVKVDIPIPEAARASLGAGFPASIDMAGDSCVTTDEFQKYADVAAKTQVRGMLTAMGLDKMSQGGIVLRQSLRIAGVEMLSTVTKIAEEAVPASDFEIPAGYKEIPAPTGIR